MPREKQGYRANIERLDLLFPDREILRVVDVMRLTGWSRDTVKRHYRFAGHTISKADLARQMSI